MSSAPLDLAVMAVAVAQGAMTLWQYRKERALRRRERAVEASEERAVAGLFGEAPAKTEPPKPSGIEMKADEFPRYADACLFCHRTHLGKSKLCVGCTHPKEIRGNAVVTGAHMHVVCNFCDASYLTQKPKLPAERERTRRTP